MKNTMTDKIMADAIPIVTAPTAVPTVAAIPTIAAIPAAIKAKPKLTKKKMILVGALLVLAAAFYFANNKIVSLQRRNAEIVKMLQGMDPKKDEKRVRDS